MKKKDLRTFTVKTRNGELIDIVGEDKASALNRANMRKDVYGVKREESPNKKRKSREEKQFSKHRRRYEIDSEDDDD